MPLVKCVTVALILVLGFAACSVAQRSAPPVHFNFDASSFYADGRIEKAEFPSETQINCNRQNGTCLSATAEYYAGHPHVSIEYFSLLKWDEDGIIASSDAICVQSTMIISFAAKSISLSGTPKSVPKEKAEACASLGLNTSHTERFVLKNSPEWNKDPYGESRGK